MPDLDTTGAGELTAPGRLAGIDRPVDGNEKSNAAVRGVAGAVILQLGLPSTAAAIQCRTWVRLASEQKPATIEQLIQDAVAGSAGRNTHINRQKVAFCLQRRARAIQEDFDAACSEGMRADLQVSNRIFKSYAWSCIQ